MGHAEWQMLLEGAWATAWISACAIACGAVLGLLVALGRRRQLPVIDALLRLYVSILRATPLVTLVLLVFFGFPSLGIEVNSSYAAVIALTLNTTAFNAEIWRNAIATFPREQVEAAKAAGMTSMMTLRRIMLPQMLLKSMPALINEMSFLIKASPAIAMVGVADLTRMTNRIAAVTYEPLPPLLAACVIYMLLIGMLVWLQRKFDQRVKLLAM